ncbi:flagellar hook-basal body complex protein [candidate division KSB1 bacterium]|nr:flagellar hook-basal body complex protein [candidate division KSB1 bacterium]
MLRSLISSVSGLRNHLVKLDVIGNNIANVNTLGFKAGRITFKDTMSQLLSGASRPVGDLGGINPMQLGTGMAVGSIDAIMNQGVLESTGNITDLAIQGDGFFILSDGETNFYTRSGAFQFDGNGKLVSPTNGFAVQGRIANYNGEIPSGVAISDIILPFGQSEAAKQTTKLSLVGNLDSGSVKGTILDSDPVYGLELAGDSTDVNSLFAYGATNNKISGLVVNESYVTVSTDGGTTFKKYYYNDGSSALVPTDSNGQFKSLDDLISRINDATNGVTGLTAALDTQGRIVFTSSAAGLDVVIASSHPNFNRALSVANDTSLDAGESSLTDVFMHKAVAADYLVNLRNKQGESLGLENSDIVTFNGIVGGTAVTETSLTVDADATTSTYSTYQDLVDALNKSLGIVNSNGVTIDANDGSITVNGDGGTANAISQLDVYATSTNSVRTKFNSVFSLNSGTWTTTQEAQDGSHKATITYYDSIGNASKLTFDYTQDDSTNNRWFWKASVEAPASIVTGGSGVIVFNEDGSLKEFDYDDGAAKLTINPNSGAESPIEISINAGTYSKFDGVTQGASPSTVVATDQDGYQMGNLNEISISDTGMISGRFTNGISKNLAQIVLAIFNNPSGLLRQGNNVFMESDNSGLPVVSVAGTSNDSAVTPGALEMSNVDLSNEFTSMIITQRGFQANARVITTSDELLTELVNLKR